MLYVPLANLSPLACNYKEVSSKKQSEHSQAALLYVEELQYIRLLEDKKRYS